MRNQTQFKKISVTKEVYDRIIEDKHHFESVIGGGAWSMSDTITEYFKILNAYKSDTNERFYCKCGLVFSSNKPFQKHITKCDNVIKEK
jgi:hypothetical protein